MNSDSRNAFHKPGKGYGGLLLARIGLAASFLYVQARHWLA